MIFDSFKMDNPQQAYAHSPIDMFKAHAAGVSRRFHNTELGLKKC